MIGGVEVCGQHQRTGARAHVRVVAGRCDDPVVPLDLREVHVQRPPPARRPARLTAPSPPPPPRRPLPSPLRRRRRVAPVVGVRHQQRLSLDVARRSGPPQPEVSVAVGGGGRQRVVEGRDGDVQAAVGRRASPLPRRHRRPHVQRHPPTAAAATARLQSLDHLRVEQPTRVVVVVVGRVGQDLEDADAVAVSGGVQAVITMQEDTQLGAVENVVG